MSYRFKAQTVVIDGVESIIIPTTLPLNPSNGHYAIDSTDGKLKVWNASKNRWIVLGDAEDIIFDNSSNDFSSDNVQEAIEEVQDAVADATLKKINLQYQFIGRMDFTQYLYSNNHVGTGGLLTNNLRRSGDTSNGYRFGNSAPIVAPYTGKIKKATFVVRGVAQSTGSSAPNVTINMELWKVGMTGNEGTKIGDVNIDVNSEEYTIGTWWNTSIITAFTGSVELDLSIDEGDLLGLKFIRIQDSSNAVALENTTVSLILEESE